MSSNQGIISFIPNTDLAIVYNSMQEALSNPLGGLFVSEYRYPTFGSADHSTDSDRRSYLWRSLTSDRLPQFIMEGDMYQAELYDHVQYSIKAKEAPKAWRDVRDSMDYAGDTSLLHGGLFVSQGRDTAIRVLDNNGEGWIVEECSLMDGFDHLDATSCSNLLHEGGQHDTTKYLLINSDFDDAIDDDLMWAILCDLFDGMSDYKMWAVPMAVFNGKDAQVDELEDLLDGISDQIVDYRATVDAFVAQLTNARFDNVTIDPIDWSNMLADLRIASDDLTAQLDRIQ